VHYDDGLDDYLAALRPRLVTLGCPARGCQARVTGRSDRHARELLAIHREAACQGEEVDGDDGSDPAPDSPADVLRLTPEPPAGDPPVPGRAP
jgi:hypothetical protein